MACSPEQARANGRKGGRPETQLVKMSKKKARQLAEDEKTPLDVMIDNMNFWWDKAKGLGTVVEEQIAKLSEIDDNEERAEALAELSKVAKSFVAARENAQRCAVDAAPYVHPRFQSISIKKVSTHTEILMALPATAQSEDRSYRDANVFPIQRTGTDNS
jgi:hypothetical protein